MRQLLLVIPVFVGCTLISDADQFVASGDAEADVDAGPTDSGGDSGPLELDSGPLDTGPFTPGSCESQVVESNTDWEAGRCCFSDEHCTGLMVRGVLDDGRCLPDSCGDAVAIASICIPSAQGLRVGLGEERCYLDRDCAAMEICMLLDAGEYASATCPDIPPLPGFCMEMP